jgi:two-component system, chemotaxis family, sensor kinase CheA
MDLSEYLPMFLAECREHLQELNLAVVRLEDAPDDRETLDAIFRAAHSLKGMSATMGFDGIARLTHQMEDVFELLRRRDTLPAAMVDVVLECLDALSAAVDEIDADGEERIAPDPLIGRLKALVRAEDDAAEAAAGAPAAAPAGRPAGWAGPVALAEGERVLTVSATLARAAMMPAVRAYMVLQAVAEHGRIVRSVPAADDVDGFAGTSIEVQLASSHEPGAVAATVRTVEDVATVDFSEPDAPAAPVAAAQAARPEAVPAPEERRGKGSSTVRVDAERLDDLMHLMGELVVARTQVEALAGGTAVAGLPQALQELTRSSQALQAMVMQIRMVPVEAVFMRFPRLVRDVAGRLDKQVHLEITGQETELDRTVVDALGDPMVHLVRNALDHGLEGPEERVAAGKPEGGTLTIGARHAGGSIVITVADDGRGVDPTKVGARAAERGLITAEEAAALDAAGAVELLFAPGFSTAEAVGDLSGRGVGMDAVRDRIRKLGGEVAVTSVHGEGTVAEIRLPLTLAIMSALLVEADGRPYGIPLNRVQRTLRIADQVIRPVAGARMLVLDDAAIPVLAARDAFGHPGEPAAEDSHLVLVGAGDRAVALTVSRLVGQVELVTRPLPDEVGEGAAVSGAAVLADGDIVLLADCDAIARTAQGGRGLSTTTTRQAA